MINVIMYKNELAKIIPTSSQKYFGIRESSRKEIIDGQRDNYTMGDQKTASSTSIGYLALSFGLIHASDATPSLGPRIQYR